MNERDKQEREMPEYQAAKAAIQEYNFSFPHGVTKVQEKMDEAASAYIEWILAYEKLNLSQDRKFNGRNHAAQLRAMGLEPRLTDHFVHHLLNAFIQRAIIVEQSAGPSTAVTDGTHDVRSEMEQVMPERL